MVKHTIRDFFTQQLSPLDENTEQFIIKMTELLEYFYNKGYEDGKENAQQDF